MTWRPATASGLAGLLIPGTADACSGTSSPPGGVVGDGASFRTSSVRTVNY